MDAKDWEAAARSADALMRVDSHRRYPTVLIDDAIIRYHLNDLDRAENSVTTAIRLDKKREQPRAEYVLGMILEARKNYTPAAEHMRKYLELDPKAQDAVSVRTRIENLGKPESTDIAVELDVAVSGLSLSPEAWIPGGMKALAAIAHLKRVPTHASFLLEYCRALARETSPMSGEGIPDYLGTIRAYITTVSELALLGERRDDTTVIMLSLADEAQRGKAEKILPLLGWKLLQKDGAVSVEPGDHPTDVLRHPIPAALGIDEIAMEETLAAGRSFQFEIASETARLEDATAWSELLKGLPAYPGGIVELFARDPRTARAYAGLNGIAPDAAAAVLKGTGLRMLVTQDASMLALYSEAFAVAKGVVALPGGAEAHAAWQKLAGASPYDPPAFFRAVLERDHGSLAAFYYAISRADAAHQRFFTKTAARTERFYTWYRDSGELHLGVDRIIGTWRPAFFQNLPLDDAGHVRFPGGKRAWGAFEAGDDSLPDLDAIEALIPLAQLEAKRKAPLDEASAALLAQHFTEWKSLLPYFEDLPGLGREEFQAVETFADAIARSRPAARDALLGQWHSLVKLIALGSRAGSLDATQAAAAFRRVSVTLANPNASASALAVLRDLAGSADLDEAIASGLLRLTGPRRAAFDRVRELQPTPRIDSLAAASDPAKTAAALSGMVYAALLDPEQLLVLADPLLWSKHRFVTESDGKRSSLFPTSTLVASTVAPGSYFAGGFAGFEGVAGNLSRSGRAVDRPVTNFSAPEATVGPAQSESAEGVPAIPANDTVFRASGRLVEVYATVTDDRGRYVDDLPANAFTITEEGKPLPAVAFESRTAAVSVALLFDTTGSMQAALPALRSAAVKLIGELRPIDSVAIYSFNETVMELQPFTADKSAAKRAVMRTRAAGSTALYDALVRVNLDLAGRPGKKVIVVFTDGSDNASVLTTDTAILRAKSAGVPIYTIAQGSALRSPALLKQLAGVSKTTGAVAFAIHGPNEIRDVFEAVSQDLLHGYLITFQPPSAEGHTWHPIEVQVRASKGRKVRAREGYYPE